MLLLPIAIVLVLGGIYLFKSPVDIEALLDSYDATADYENIQIKHPFDGAVFPRDIAPPLFEWSETNSAVSKWLITFQFQDDAQPLHFVSEKPRWIPSLEGWNTIKQQSLGKSAQVRILGFHDSGKPRFYSRSRIRISTSQDEVDASIFYREVNLPFIDAVKDPTRIRWRFGGVEDTATPRVVLKNLPVCGNCHSFSRDGGLLGMDVDYANNKGSYVVTRTAKEMTLATSDILSWSEFREEDEKPTFGLLSSVSPSGRYVISTVKDRSVFVPKPGLEFSQLFFPIQGILAFYDRQTKTFSSLPGADNPEYVQSNPTWSPDGDYVVFARSKAYELKNNSDQYKILLSPEDCAEFSKKGKPFKFDLYRVPFNNGEGGTPEPIEGASNNGKSNFFPKYSPDGRWIIFCRAENYMLLQPDSELFIIPAEGGTAQKLDCNLPLMNSWHSWSPNGHWLVFSSKTFSPFTQLFLTHIDENGASSPPVWLWNFTETNRAANIPEFANLEPDAIVKIREEFLDDYSLACAGFTAEQSDDIDLAIKKYLQAIEMNPNCVQAHQRLGTLLFNQKQQFAEGLKHMRITLQLDPKNAFGHYNLGMALFYQDKIKEAIPHLSKAVEFMPEGFASFYDPAQMRFQLGRAYLLNGNPDQAIDFLNEALSIDTNAPKIIYVLSMALAAKGNIDSAEQNYQKAVRLNAGVDTSPELHDLMASKYAESGRINDALRHLQQALELARAQNRNDLVSELENKLRAIHGE
ncbi:MAG: tetratricopeptide repeat protein [Verrucomicrobia bacterium]|nr:tetratricopeptide repeat protein [Verrucomicrobiota bacterium]